MDAGTSRSNAFSALAQDGRLAVFRLLVKAGPAGIAAGPKIARTAGSHPQHAVVPAQCRLANAGLVTSRRDGRSIIYAAAYDAMERVARLPDGERLLPGAAGGLRADGRSGLPRRPAARSPEERSHETRFHVHVAVDDLAEVDRILHATLFDAQLDRGEGRLHEVDCWTIPRSISRSRPGAWQPGHRSSGHSGGERRGAGRNWPGVLKAAGETTLR